MSAYRMISAEKAQGFPVSAACRLFGVSHSAYYEWEGGVPSDRALTDAWLLEQIKRIHAEHRGVYGWRRSVRTGLGGTRLARNGPDSSSWQSHWASMTSVL